MVLLSLMLLAAQDGDLVADAMANYRVQTRADVPCAKPSGDDEIMVCGYREADKYRVPLVSANNASNSVPLRTGTLTKDYQRMQCGQTAFTSQCGSMVGVGATIGQDGSVGMVRRELAH